MSTPQLIAAAYAPCDITAYAGDTFKAQMTFTNLPGNTPLDLTGVALKMQIRLKATSAALETLSVGDGITIATNVVTFSKALTIKGGNYFYDLQATFPSGDIITYVAGKFTVVQDITDPIIK